ncbi:MAG: DNA translocase FtsK 4TM domain-containing protein [Gammaproteobacteria bacterium]|nr:DNA translocase FtsK 4TM domain-containing protein [Gammaproteobacteria bacterium]MCI0590715.1 DNA translocase FtsK 4TM domain-containing protein [Gammaproteobacteria bacterium]
MHGSREGALIVLLALAVFLLIALASHHPGDPGWSHTGMETPVVNKGGVVGAWIADVLYYLFGYLAYLVPIMVAYAGWLFVQRKRTEGPFSHFQFATRGVGLVLALASSCGLAWLHFKGAVDLPHGSGGVLGEVAGEALVYVFGWLGATLFMLALFLTGITVVTGFSWLWLMDTTGRYTLWFLSQLSRGKDQVYDYLRGLRARRDRESLIKQERERAQRRSPPSIGPAVGSIETGTRAEKERQVPLFEPPQDTVLPPISLLDSPTASTGGYSKESLEAMSRQVELKLHDFGVEVEVVAVHPGPVITRFELQPAPGVKGSQISSLSKDLARSLSTISVRVVDVIPGKSVVGLEIPNEQRELVTLREILNSYEYESSQSGLTLALGKDIGGSPVVVDLAKMPHLLVAGTTGSGKSVALNAMILSMLYKATVAEIRLIMIDPKMLELSVYEGIPHLLTPVVTDVKEAANALRWGVVEMDRRYRLMAALGVRNIAGYNRKIKQAAAQGESIRDPLYVPENAEDVVPALQTLPYVVVIVDELADMMMTVGKKVEELVARLAQKARASGIHLILATQRPSVDVITGLIKANIPVRIAFQVSARVDSRTILDQMGAETLLGHGDMLYLAPGTGVPMRVHGAFVADHEVHKVVRELKAHGKPEYMAEILRPPRQGGADMTSAFASADDDLDNLYDEAVRIVTETRRASISAVQRRLKVGYNRAARMIEAMERSGIVGPLQSNGAREVIAPPPPED